MFKDHMMRKPVKSALGQLSTKVKIVDNQFDGEVGCLKLSST